MNILNPKNKNIMLWKLFYDKFAGDHHFSNPLTKNVSVNDLEDGSYYLYSGIDAIEYYNGKFKSHFQIPEFILDSDIYKLNIFIKTIEGVDTIYTVIGINSKRLEYYIKNKKKIPHEDFLKKLCRYHLSYTNSNRLAASMFYNNAKKNVDKITENIKFIIDKTMNPIDYTFHDKIDKQEDLTVELYNYQKCSIYWMLEKEKNKKQIYYNMNEEVIIDRVYFDMYNQTFNILDDRKSLIFSGGCLIDEVGLGKTIQMITLSMLNQSTSTAYTNKDDETHLYSRATLVCCPNQLCGQWEREIEDKITEDYDPKICKIMTKRHFDKYTYQDLLDADFVIVSFTFLGNNSFTLPWSQKVSSVKSFCKQNWNTNEQKSVEDTFDKMGKDLVENPIESLTKTNPFFQLIHWHRLVIDEFHEVYANPKYSYIANILPYITSTYKWCVTATPFVKQKNTYHILNFLTNFKNTDGENILTSADFIDFMSTECFRRNTKESVKQEHTLPPIEEEIRWLKFTKTERMMYNAYLANPNNDKFSVYLRQLCCHPQLADETKLALSNCKTLKEIENMIISHYKTDVENANIKVNKINNRIKKVNKKIRKLEKKQKKMQLKKIGIEVDSDSSSDSESASDNEENYMNQDTGYEMNNLDTEDLEELENNLKNLKSVTMDNLKESLGKLEIRLQLAKKDLDGKTTTFNFFNNVIERLRKTTTKESNGHGDKCNGNEEFNVTDFLNADEDSMEDDEETCGICLDDIPEDDVGVTKCGHIFCYECLKMVVRKYHNCPYCKGKLNDNEIYTISYEKEKKKDEITPEDKKKDDLINEIGTKLANLIFFLRENDNHTIIFSQWDDLLRRVGRILANNGIKNVFCKGNCYQRDKAIREFNKNDSIKVIMLSSEQSASGTNLTKATQVILLDPIYGNYKYRKGQEKQAIGRAHRLGQLNKIKVVRFIIKNSVEEEIYWMNVKEDEKYSGTKDINKVKEITIKS